MLCLFLLNSRRNANAPQRVALPTPTYGSASSKPYGSAASFGASKPYGSASFDTSKPSHATSFEKSAPSYYDNIDAVGTAPPAPSSTYDNQVRTLVQSARIEMCHVLDQVFFKQMHNENVTGHC